MTHLKLKLPFSIRPRRRLRRREDPADVFKTFVQVLARMQAHARGPSPAAALERE